MMDDEAVQTLIDMVASTTAVREFGDEHGVIVAPSGYSVHDISKFLPPPNRPKEKIALFTLASFVEYVSKFGRAGVSAVFADTTTNEFVAVLDYHDPAEGGRGTGEHIARYTCPLSPEWETWAGERDGKYVAQAEFARFIENNLPDIVAPAPADMLQLALTLQVKKDASYSSDLRLDTGQTQFRYEETIRGTTKAGDLTIPDSFTIAVPVFLGEPRVNVTARLRYRIQEAKLVIGYELVRPKHVRLAEITRVTEDIAQKLPGFALYVGRR